MLESIDPAQLATVTGGNMEFHPTLVGTLEQVWRRKRSTKPDTTMQTVSTALSESMSNLKTSISQTQQQQSQATAQMLPQMMAGR